MPFNKKINVLPRKSPIAVKEAEGEKPQKEEKRAEEVKESEDPSPYKDDAVTDGPKTTKTPSVDNGDESEDVEQQATADSDEITDANKVAPEAEDKPTTDNAKEVGTDEKKSESVA